MKAVLVAAVAVFALNASAATLSFDARISKTFPFPISSLQKVEQAMQAAAANPNAKDDQITQIDPAALLRCSPGDPTVVDGHPYGCALYFTVDLGNGASATLTEMVYLRQSSTEAQGVLNAADPNKTSRVDLTTPFDGGNGSTYYCNAEGANGAKAWACYLNVID